MSQARFGDLVVCLLKTRKSRRHPHPHPALACPRGAELRASRRPGARWGQAVSRPFANWQNGENSELIYAAWPEVPGRLKQGRQGLRTFIHLEGQFQNSRRVLSSLGKVPDTIYTTRGHQGIQNCSHFTAQGLHQIKLPRELAGIFSEAKACNLSQIPPTRSIFTPSPPPALLYMVWDSFL